jgi:hypothetical protein
MGLVEFHAIKYTDIALHLSRDDKNFMGVEIVL